MLKKIKQKIYDFSGVYDEATYIIEEKIDILKLEIENLNNNIIKNMQINGDEKIYIENMKKIRELKEKIELLEKRGKIR